MRAKLSLDRPDKLEATMTVTMTIQEWRAIKARMSSNEWPDWAFANLIAQLIGKACSSYDQAEDVTT